MAQPRPSPRLDAQTIACLPAMPRSMRAPLTLTPSPIAPAAQAVTAQSDRADFRVVELASRVHLAYGSPIVPVPPAFLPAAPISLRTFLRCHKSLSRLGYTRARLQSPLVKARNARTAASPHFARSSCPISISVAKVARRTCSSISCATMTPTPSTSSATSSMAGS